MNLSTPFILTVLILSIISGCLTDTKTPDKSGYINISVIDAKKLIDSEDVYILDVRTPQEYNSGHINGSNLMAIQDIPKEGREFKLKDIPKDKKILVYCRSGSRSAQASQILVDNGFTRVYNMQGGIIEWMDAGYPAIK